jgi:hypothetical protein
MIGPALILMLVTYVLLFAATSAGAQGVQPYPDAITNRLFYAKTPMTPPAAHTPFSDPDLGGLMVRITNENSNPKIP